MATRKEKAKGCDTLIKRYRALSALHQELIL